MTKDEKRALIDSIAATTYSNVLAFLTLSRFVIASCQALDHVDAQLREKIGQGLRRRSNDKSQGNESSGGFCGNVPG
jgi:hypothetical protein